MQPRHVGNEELARRLREVADLVEKGDSLEGTFSYMASVNEEGEWGYLARAVIRDNPHGGQGSVHMLGTMDLGDAPFAEQAMRAEMVVPLYVYAMRRELRANYFKGKWWQWSTLGCIKDLVYHAAKLAFQLRKLEKQALLYMAGAPSGTPEESAKLAEAVARAKRRVLEQAADCGNLAMFAADMVGALEVNVVYARAHEKDLAGSWDYEAADKAAYATQVDDPG